MAKGFEKYDINNTVFVGEIAHVREEKYKFSYSDQVLACQSLVNISGIELMDDEIKHKISSVASINTELLKNDEVKKEKIIITDTMVVQDRINTKEEYQHDTSLKDHVHPHRITTDISNTENPIEFLTINNPENSYGINDKIKIEDGIDVVNIKTEFNNLVCDQCHEVYQDYCMKCPMLLHILNRNVPSDCHNRVREEIPKDILQIRESSEHTGIFLLKTIPNGVKFGPCTGLNIAKCLLRIKRGNFIVTDSQSKALHWMQYINTAKSISERNLFPFENDGNLYYRSIREIEKGEELLIYFGEECEGGLNKDVVMDFILTSEKDAKDVFGCTFCCLGFSSKVHLAKHKTVCCNKSNGMSSLEVLQISQCSSCKIYLEQKEYFEYHMAYCCEKDTRQSMPSTSSIQSVDLNEHSSHPSNRRRQHLDIYKCSQCKYKTAYKSDLNSHTNKHYQVKAFNCLICRTRFKQKETLNLHMLNTHIYVAGSKTYRCFVCLYETRHKSNLKVHLYAKHWQVKKHKCSKCKYQTAYISSLKIHLLSHKKVKRFSCSHCVYETNFRSCFLAHVDAKHSDAKRYKCPKCPYQSAYRDCLEAHLYTHEKEKRFKCPHCEQRTNYKSHLKVHINTIHCTERAYKCSQCTYAGATESALRKHRNNKHTEVKRFKCSQCEYGTHYKGHLIRHVSSHETIKKFKCDQCNFETNINAYLKRHIQRKHCEIKMMKQFKCSMCAYVSNYKANLKLHVAAKHCESKRYNCTICDFKTSIKACLNKHMSVKHCDNDDEKEQYKCAKCIFATCYKENLKRHLRTHEKIRRLKCSQCEYMTNYEKCLKTHLLKHDVKVKIEESF